MIRKCLAVAGIVVAFTAAGLLGGVGSASGSETGWAWNGPAHIATSYGPYIFCGTNNQLCMDTHGVYNQLTVDTVNAGSATITLTKNGTYMGVTAYDLSDGNGNCIKTNNSNQIVVANGPCNGSDQQEKWAWFGNTSSGQFQNASDGNFLGVDQWSDGSKVWNNPSATNWQLEYVGG